MYSISCHVLSNMSIGTVAVVSRIRVPKSWRCCTGVANTRSFTYPPEEKVKWSDVWQTWWPWNWSTASNPAIWEGFYEGILNILAPMWWGSMLLKDYFELQISYLGVQELFQHVLVYQASYWLLMEEKRTDNPVLPVLCHYCPMCNRWINCKQRKHKILWVSLYFNTSLIS